MRLSLMGIVKGFETITEQPHSRVTFKVNRCLRYETLSDENGIAKFKFKINFPQPSFAKVTSESPMSNYFLIQE